MNISHLILHATQTRASLWLYVGVTVYKLEVNQIVVYMVITTIPIKLKYLQHFTYLVIRYSAFTDCGSEVNIGYTDEPVLITHSDDLVTTKL